MCVMLCVLLAVAHLAYVVLVGGLAVPLRLLFMMIACADSLHLPEARLHARCLYGFAVCSLHFMFCVGCHSV